MLSVADFVAVQCFALAAAYITHKTNCLPALAAFKSAQRRDLLTVVVAYELSAIFSLSFDALMRFGNFFLTKQIILKYFIFCI